jgi:hypothetical protein
VAEVLAVLVRTTGDVRPWLATWSAIGGSAAARQLCDFMTANPYAKSCLDWSPESELNDFDRDAAADQIERWLLRDGIDILSALPPGADLDAGLAQLVGWEDGLWWLWWPPDQLGPNTGRPDA